VPEIPALPELLDFGGRGHRYVPLKVLNSRSIFRMANDAGEECPGLTLNTNGTHNSQDIHKMLDGCAEST
jgi:hypothetical protein